MFERYSESARHSLFMARYEASVFGSPEIATHHMLLALLQKSWDTFAPFLKSTDVIANIRADLRTQYPRIAEIPIYGDLPLSNGLKRALAYAAEEAERLHQRTIEPEHIALGLLREQDAAEREGVVAGILAHYGIALDQMRAAAMQKGPQAPALDAENITLMVESVRQDRREVALRILHVLSESAGRINIATPDGKFTLPFGPQNRLDVARRVLAALGETAVTIAVVTSQYTSSFSFGLEDRGPKGGPPGGESAA